MKQEETQRNPNHNLRETQCEVKAQQFQQIINKKLQAPTYSQIQDTNKKQQALNTLVNEATQELFPPKPKPIRKPWITHETHALIQLQQTQWHEARIAGNQLGIPRWEQAFKQLDQTKQQAPENQHNRIEK